MFTCKEQADRQAKHVWAAGWTEDQYQESRNNDPNCGWHRPSSADSFAYLGSIITTKGGTRKTYAVD